MEYCPICDTFAEKICEDRPLRMGRREVVVAQEYMRCPECEEEFFLPDQMDAAQERASRAIREREGLLQPEEIRAIRDRLGLTQNQFERLLGVGPKTVVRWERGTVFQNNATDSLLRLVAADRNNAKYLAELHAVDLPSFGDSVTYEDHVVRGRVTGSQGLTDFMHRGRPIVFRLEDASTHQAKDTADEFSS